MREDNCPAEHPRTWHGTHYRQRPARALTCGEPAFDALAAEGILDGTECGEDPICPEEEIKRWVVAVWLVRALEGEEPAAEGLSRFEDVDAEEWWWAPYVERLAELEVTKGCAVEPKKFVLMSR